MTLFDKKHVSLPGVFRGIQERDKVRIIRLKGSVDAGNVNEIQKFVQKLRVQKGYEFKNLLIDFKDVPYADSAAVAELIRVLMDCKKAHHELGVVNLSGEVLNLFEVLKVNTLIRSYLTEEEALKALE